MPTPRLALPLYIVLICGAPGIKAPLYHGGSMAPTYSHMHIPASGCRFASVRGYCDEKATPSSMWPRTRMPLTPAGYIEQKSVLHGLANGQTDRYLIWSGSFERSIQILSLLPSIHSQTQPNPYHPEIALFTAVCEALPTARDGKTRVTPRLLPLALCSIGRGRHNSRAPLCHCHRCTHLADIQDSHLVLYFIFHWRPLYVVFHAHS